MNIDNIINLLKIANNDIPSVEYRYQQLRKETASLEAHNRNAARTLLQLAKEISETQNILDHYSSVCKQQKSEMDELYLKKTQLEELVEDFKINNEGYLKVRENVKQEVESTIANP
jgi:chromosome segregation ATPase